MVARLPLLAPATAVVLLDRFGAADANVLFVLAALTLIPIAWLIGEATDQAEHHTGPGIGGFLNASFGNAPELIIALVAVSHGLPEVVRASLVGSVVGNLLLVLGFALLAGPRGEIDRVSASMSLGVVLLAALLVLVPSAFAWGGSPTRTRWRSCRCLLPSRCSALASSSIFGRSAVTDGCGRRPGRQRSRLGHSGSPSACSPLRR